MTNSVPMIDPQEIAGNRWLSIIGIGEDGIEGLGSEARRLIAAADLVAGGARHLALAAPLIRGAQLPWPSPLEGAYPEIAARRGRPVVVLASGDPMHYGIGKKLLDLVSADEMRCLPQPSAFSLAAARLGWALQDTALVSLHGRALERIIPVLQPGRRILALAWDGTTAAKLAGLMQGLGFGCSNLTVLENLGGPRERCRSTTMAEFALDAIDPLNTLAIEVRGEGRAIPLTPGLDDALFENDGQLTKREIRALTLASLAPRHGDLLWDIGLGAGSIAIEWMLADPSLRAIGFEERAERAARARRNAQALGVPGLDIVEGKAPAALAGLPRPDSVFIGGGLTDEGVFEHAFAALKPGGRFVANAVTLESEARLTALHAAHGGELVRIAVSRATPVGALTGWRPAMPVTHWRVRKP